jgi:hypothetical protein
LPKRYVRLRLALRPPHDERLCEVLAKLGSREVNRVR